LPSGIVHYNFFKAGYLIEIPEALYLTILNPFIGIPHLVGYSAHRYIDNDWDILGTNKAESRAIHELKIFGYILYGISSIYGAIFMRHHRSIQTHFPIVSTIIRLFFVFWWLLLLYYFGYIHYAVWQLEIFLGFLWGLSQADMTHYFADLIWNEKHFEEKGKINEHTFR
jgi:O-antigen/teichoic acid export membrane protein